MIKSSNVKTVFFNDAVKDINFNNNYNDLTLDHQKIHFANGLNCTITSFSSAVQDVAISNNSLLMIAENININKIFKEPPKDIDLKDLLYQSAIFIEISNESREVKYLSSNFVSYTDNIIDENVFRFKFYEDYVSLLDTKNNAFTERDTFFCSSAYTGDINQRFNYILNEAGIILFKYKSNFQYVICFNGYDPKYIDVIQEGSIPVNSVLYLETFKDLKIKPNSLVDSFVAKYDSNPLSAKNSIEIVPSSRSSIYNQQFLFNLPYENLNNKIYINSLKNYQTANYNYLSNRNNARYYTNLFTGNNQHTGYDNLFLNYKSSTLEKIFKCDEDVVFYYPSTISLTGIYLSSAGLIEDGAIAGKNPYTSDRVYLHNIDYREINQINNITKVDGTWICAWLSGDNINSVWMDRYYTGASTEQNLYEKYNIVDKNEFIIDTPSSLKFLPNVAYRYFHQGQNNYQNYIQKLNNIDGYNKTLLLNVTSWSNNKLQDLSEYNNAGVIINNTEPLVSEYFKLDGKSYAIFSASSLSQENKQLTIGFWLNTENWKEIEGYQIFGNFADGGIGLFNKQIIPTSLFTLYDPNNSYIYNFNSNISLISEQKANNFDVSNNTKPIWIFRNIDQSYWIVDDNHKIATKYDINNNKIFQIDLEGLHQISQVEVDSNQNIYIVDQLFRKIIKLNNTTGQLEYNIQTGIKLPQEFNRIEILKNYQGDCIVEEDGNYIVGVVGDFSTTDSKNNIWSVIGTSLYKNNIYYAYIGKVIQIICDRSDNLWILHDINKLTKIETVNNNFIFTKTYTNNTFTSNRQQQYISFITVKNLIEEDYAIIIDNFEKQCYLINDKGEEINKTNLLSIPSAFLLKNNFIRDNINYSALGDFTNYNYQRKFANTRELEWKIHINENVEYLYTIENIINIPIETNNLNQGWHYFSIVFNSSSGSVQCFINGIKLKEILFKPHSISIKNNNKPYSIGATTTSQGILNDLIGINDTHKFKGLFANLHIYKYAFDEYDINSFYRSTYINMFKDLIWNINVGERNYIERIDKFFMNKMPGSKSKLFNIKINNFPANAIQKEIIEQSLRAAIHRIAPADTILNKIKWV